MVRARRPRALVVVGIASLSVLLVACGPDDRRTSLAIDTITAEGPITTEVDGDLLVITTECATDVTVEVRPDPAGSGLPQVSLWGRPKVGRCHPVVTVPDVDTSAGKVIDAATGQVVDLEP